MPIDIEDPPSLAAYLSALGRISFAEGITSRILQGGVSNKTVLATRATGEAWVIKQALPKLRTKIDWFSDPARIHREALALRHLPDLTPPGTITPLIFEDEENHILAMEAVPQPHDNWKDMLLAGLGKTDQFVQYAAILANIHYRSWKAGKALAGVFEDRQFFQSLRLEPYYEFTARRVHEANQFLTALVADTLAAPLALVHGDYSPKNILVRDGKLILLDHEVIHWGAPSFDVGFAMAHLLSKAHHLASHRQDFLEHALTFWRTYDQRVSDIGCYASLEAFSVRQTLACLLARVEGRSPLEYLTDNARARQRKIVLQMIADLPEGIPELIERFGLHLEVHE